ncbi:MAG: hypothetical protein HY822_14165 [Acidobacteria bacterium]|nr:hypothetical protein [Acidobacteriota bacterium]
MTLPESRWTRGRNLIAALALAGAAASAAGWASNPRQFFASYLVAYVFFVLLALGGMFFVMLQHLTGAVWSAGMLRIMENVMVTVPLAALLFVPVAAGIPTLYEWSHPEFASEDPVMAVKMAFFNPVFYTARMLLYFGVWSALALILYRRSKDRVKAAWWSGPGMAALMVTVTMASVDWLMSLEPHWYSTIFGVYIFSGGVLAFVATLTLVLLLFRRAGVLAGAVTVGHYHDLGKWMFALTIFWAYIAFSQYLLIWYANLPEETIWFQHRLEGNWIYISGVLLFGRFLLPFVVLLARAPKRNLAVLAVMSVWMLAMHFADLHWVVMPTLHRHGFHLHWLDLATLVAVGSLFALAFWWRLERVTGARG